LLVLIGQYTMAKSHAMLEDTIRAAIAAKVAAREVLEIILQCVVYGGHVTVDPAIQVFHRVAGELGLIEELRASQLPTDGNDRKRSLEAERKTWHADDVADPRCAALVARHGWLAVGRGLALRPRHHLNILAWLDAMDPEFAGLWVKFCYGGMYSRGIVDDKTRLLCMIGDCLAVGEGTQAKGHMRGAMRNGASPREVMEVILQTCVNFGMPPMLHALGIFVQLMAEDGRLAEIGNPPKSVESYAK
jgi:alkylhydroperoxidase/carboxymuconolactone decarboxylase family protein YurZ